MTEQHQAAISKVWKEALSTEEKLLLLEEINRNEANWKAVLKQQFDQDLQSGAQYLSPARSELILKQLHERIRLMDEAATGIEQPGRAVQMRSRFIRRAAAIAASILVLAGFFWYPSKKMEKSKGTLALYQPVREYQRRTNQTREEQSFRLQDGSEVRLAPGAAIVWQDGFSSSERKIHLSGKAWFNVAKDSRRPFSVSAGAITTTALGTKFMISPLSHSKVAVQLFEGKVKIEAVPGMQNIGAVFLEPGQQCIIDAQMRTAVSSIAANDPSADHSQQSSEEKTNTLQRIKPLEFVQTPLADVLTQLGNRYHVQFRYDRSELGNDQVTGTFYPSDSLNVALKLLRTINNLSFSQYQDTIFVNKQK